MSKKTNIPFAERFAGALVLAKVLLYVALEVVVILGVLSLELPLFAALLISNIATFAIALRAAKSFKMFAADISKNEIDASRREERLQEQIKALEEANRDLKNRLDTGQQTISHFNKLNFGVKVELMESLEVGYIVKQESLESMESDERFQKYLPSPNLIERGRELLKIEGDAPSILYIDKVYHKSSIGINLANIKYATNRRGEILLSGVELEVLHNTSSDLVPSSDDVKHCWIFTTDDDGDHHIKNQDRYRDLRDFYKEYQEQTLRAVHADNDRALCRRYTQGLQASLSERYGNLLFVDRTLPEYSDYAWHSLKDGCESLEVMKIVLDIHMNIETMKHSNETKQLTVYN